MQAVIFLDIDGVLNSFRWLERAEAASTPVGPATAERIARAAGYLHIPPAELARDLQRLDPDAVARLARLVRDTDSSVVVSSSWRAVIDYQGLEEVFARLTNWPRGTLRDQTPMLDMLFGRGREIDAWLEANPRERYVILDDLPTEAFPGHEDRLVQTDMEEGLQNEHCLHAWRLLTVS
jgi:hypothetical protein